MRMYMAALWIGGALAAAANAPDLLATEAYIRYVAGLLGVAFTATEQQELQQQIAGYWASRDRESISTVTQSASTWAQMARLDPALRSAGLRMTQPDALLGLHKAARQGRSDSQWLLNVYYQRNPMLAEGKPGGLPLTRDMVEAQLGVQHWLATEIHRTPAPPPDARVIEAAIRHASQQHAAFTPEQQVALARQPGELARIRYGWERASAADKLLARADMGAALTPQEQTALQQIMGSFNAQLNGMLSQHRNAMLGSALSHMRETTDTIMGRGTVWNPTTNRWEQQGGVVTEYNGTVRVP